MSFLIALQPLSALAQVHEVGQAEPETALSVNQDYVIAPGDILDLVVEPQSELNREVDVGQDGTVQVPNIGSIRIAGQQLGDVRLRIQTGLSRYLVSPRVQLRVKHAAGRNVTLTGYIGSPGVYPFKDGMKLNELVGRAGGYQYQADRKAVRVYRGEVGQRRLFLIDAEAIMTAGDLSKDFGLSPGDFIEIKRAETKVYVFGEVGVPGAIEHEPGMNLLSLVSRAQGLKDFAKTGNVRIFRSTPQPRMLQVDFSKVLDGHPDKDVLVQPGDIVYFPRKKIATASAYANLISPWVGILTFILTIEVLARVR